MQLSLLFVVLCVDLLLWWEKRFKLNNINLGKFYIEYRSALDPGFVRPEAFIKREKRNQFLIKRRQKIYILCKTQNFILSEYLEEWIIRNQTKIKDHTIWRNSFYLLTAWHICIILFVLSFWLRTLMVSFYDTGF